MIKRNGLPFLLTVLNIFFIVKPYKDEKQRQQS